MVDILPIQREIRNNQSIISVHLFGNLKILIIFSMHAELIVTGIIYNFFHDPHPNIGSAVYIYCRTQDG